MARSQAAIAADSTDEQERADVSQRRRKAYAEATTALREARQDEFQEFYAEACERNDVPYTRRLNAEEKAEQQIHDLLEAHPSLRETFGQTA